MKEWYESLSRRDQLLLWPLSLMLLLVLLYGLVWSPLTDATTRLTAANESALDTLGWMHEAVAQVKKSSGGAGSRDSTQSVSTLIDRSLPRHTLVMKRYQPVGEGGAQVSLEDAELANVIAWLSELEIGSGVRLVSVSIVSSDKSGLVKVRVRLERG